MSARSAIRQADVERLLRAAQNLGFRVEAVARDGEVRFAFWAPADGPAAAPPRPRQTTARKKHPLC